MFLRRRLFFVFVCLFLSTYTSLRTVHTLLRLFVKEPSIFNPQIKLRMYVLVLRRTPGCLSVSLFFFWFGSVLFVT